MKKLFPMERQRRVFMGLTLVAAFSIGVLSYGVFQQGQAIRDQRNQLAQLTQQLCDNLSIERTASNAQIRRPLQSSLSVLAALIRQSGAKNPGDGRMAKADRLAAQFQHLANQVTLVGPIHCRFTTSSSLRSGATPGPLLSLPPGLLIIHSPGGTTTVVTIPPGATFEPSPSPSPKPKPTHGGNHLCHPGSRCWCFQHPNDPRCPPTN